MISSLRKVLQNRQSVPAARWHAIWALDAIDRGVMANSDILQAAEDPDPSVRRQAIRQLGTRRVPAAVKPLIARLADGDASVRFHAATALGRIAAPAAIAPLLASLNETNLFVRFAQFNALNRIGRSDSRQWVAIVNGLDHTNNWIREGTEFALRNTYDEVLVELLRKISSDRNQPAATRVVTLRLLAPLHHQTKPWTGEWWAYHPVNSPAPEKTNGWAGTPAVLAALVASLADPDPTVRLTAVHGIRDARHVAAAGKLRGLFAEERDAEIRPAIVLTLGGLHDEASVPLVEGLLRESESPAGLRGEAIAAAAELGGKRLEDALLGQLRSQPSSPDTTLKLLQALGKLRAGRGSELIAANLRHPNREVRDAAGEALARIGGEAALQATLKVIDDPALPARLGAIDAAGKLRNKAAIPALLRAYTDPLLRTNAILALAQVPDERGLDAYLDGLAARNASVRELCRKALRAIETNVLSRIESRIESLTAETIAELRLAYADSAQAKKGKLFTEAIKTLEPRDYENYAMSRAGDPVQGREIFHNENGVACIKCHVIGSRGGIVGPDLSAVGTQFARAALIESILAPSKVVREGYNQVLVETKDETNIAGLFKGETADELMLLDSNNQLRRIPKIQIKNRHTSDLSLMPESLQSALTLPEFSDLIAYLESLKGPTSLRP